MFDRLSEELKQARERSGLTLQQLVNKTKIDIRYIQAMEDGNFSFQPDLYVKAFLKSYAKFVGLDENQIIRKYQAIKEGKPYQEQTSLSQEDKTSTVPRPESERRETAKEIKKQPVNIKPPTFENDRADYSDQSSGMNKRNIVIFGALAGVLVLFALVYYFFLRPSTEIIVTEKPYEEIVQENSDRYADLEPKKDSVVNNPVQGVVQDSLKLRIFTGDTTWVKLTIDNTRSDEFLLFPGGQKTIAAKENYKILFGNSKSIKLQLNNKPLDFTTQGRKRLSVLVDTGGVHIAAAPVKKQE